MNKACKYRIYPTTSQQELLSKTFGCCRFIWNVMLNDKIAYYKEHKFMLQTTPAQYKDAYPFLKDVDSLALSNVQLHLQQAYKNFFRDKSVGFPKHKSKKHSKASYTTNNQNGTICISDGFIRLPKIGKIKIKLHRTFPNDWVIKSATISQESDGIFYVSVLYEYNDVVTTIDTTNINESKVLGLDYKSDGLYMDSEGRCADMPHYYRNAQKRLAKAQRKLSRKVGNTKGSVKSNNYLKYQRKVNKIHRHVANQRKDYLHKLSTEITNQYDIICVESLDMQSISKGLRLGKATMDNGYGMFLNMIAYKQADKGHLFIKVDKLYPSSQLCYVCGYKQKLKLSDRVYVCPQCGNVVDRDYNAAINIKKEGLRLLLAS